MAFALAAMGSIILLFCIAYPKFGFYLLITFVFFISFFERLLNTDLHVGLIPKIITGAIFIGILLKKVIHREKILTQANNPITYIYLLYIIYLGIEAFNPNIDSLVGWTSIFTGSILFFLYYLAATYIFSNKREITFFLKFWLALGLFSALYGCYQQWFGLPPWEYHWLLSDPHRFALLYQNGFIRKYSFMADPPSFGILMASTAILALSLAIGKITMPKRLLLIFTGLIMLVAMSYSGTRMATAVIPFGILFSSMLTIQNKKTILFLGIAMIIGLGIMFMPVYGSGVLIRIRSTFHPQEDPSMQVRALNRKRIQPYMHEHPIGGGLNTAGGAGLENYPNHPLAGFPPDGMFMQTALEQGWIGFGLLLIMMFSVLKYGIHQYYNCRNNETKFIYASVLSTIFCWYMAQYAQSGQGAFNIAYLYMASLALLVRLGSFEV
jgi:hypothetical protein